MSRISAGAAVRPNDDACLRLGPKTCKTPFLWSGSKDSNWQTIRTYIPQFQTYFEPFVGGGSLYFRLLAERGPIRAFCTDIHEDLIAAYEVIRDDAERLITLLPATKCRDTFNLLLASEPSDKIERAARFLYLNRNRFFGLGGWTNCNRYAREEVIARIRFFSPLMQATKFSARGFKHFPLDVSGGFTFLDPPYPGANNTACYGMSEKVDPMSLAMQALDRVAASGANFLLITRHTPYFETYADRPALRVETRHWSYRKPGKRVQLGSELYVSRVVSREDG
jgi:DNA adenine methylase